MKTKILSASQIKEAASLIKKGCLVAFPTETVYGLGADALNAAAAAAIFAAKGRPHSNPLIVHCCDLDQVRSIAVLTTDAEILARAFWPGPLTMVLRKKDVVPDVVTSGSGTVGVRIPAHPVALKLIRAAGVPVAAPSANAYMRTSPTKAEHVLEDLDGKIAAVIKAGQSKIGVESTVVDLTSRVPRVLRPGGIAFRRLKKALPATQDYTGVASKKSPGQHKYHYCPKAPLVPVRSSAEAVRLMKKNAHRKSAILSYTEWIPKFSGLRVEVYDWGRKADMERLAKRLYGGLRHLDAKGADVIYCPLPAESGLGQAIVNRLKKACGA